MSTQRAGTVYPEQLIVVEEGWGGGGQGEGTQHFCRCSEYCKPMGVCENLHVIFIMEKNK